MIEKVPHRCKFAEYGCEVKDFLCQLKIHEGRCKERTVKCPHCEAVVQLKKFREHVMEKECCVILGTSVRLTFSSGFLKWDGTSKKRGKEFDLDQEINFKMVNNGKDYYVFEKYLPSSQSFVFAVLMPKESEEVEQYSEMITIFSKTFKHLKTTFECSVTPIDHFPSEEDFPFHDGCWNVHYSFLRKFFEFEDEGENNNHKLTVTLNWSIEVMKKKKDQ